MKTFIRASEYIIAMDAKLSDMTIELLKGFGRTPYAKMIARLASQM